MSFLIMNIVDILMLHSNEASVLDINPFGVIMSRNYILFRVKGASVDIYFEQYMGKWIVASSSKSAIWGHGGPLSVEFCEHFETLGEGIIKELEYNEARFTQESESMNSCASTTSRSADKKMALLLKKHKNYLTTITLEEYQSKATFDSKKWVLTLEE